MKLETFFMYIEFFELNSRFELKIGTWNELEVFFIIGKIWAGGVMEIFNYGFFLTFSCI
jgi:hypothetical protein